MLKRSTIINRLINKYGYKDYLEIGVQRSINFNKINVKNKTGVDPDKNSGANYIMTSNKFFTQNKKKFDIIFIDGLHHADQVYQDVINSLKCLKEGGTIVCHDMKPENKEMQVVPRQTKIWTGDCWRAWVSLRHERDDLEMYVVDTDMGVGVIRRGEQVKIFEHDIDYEEFESHKAYYLNLLSVKEYEDMEYGIKGEDFFVHHIMPYGINKQYGKAINYMCSKIPDNDWICVYDMDTMILTPNFGDLVHQVIKYNRGVGLFTCYTNRTKNKNQLIKEYYTEFDLKKLRREAVLRYMEYKLEIQYTQPDLSGHMMCFSKKTWENVGGFAEKEMFRGRGTIVGIDTDFVRKVYESEKKLAIMKGVFLIHGCRLDTFKDDASHLR